MGIFQEFRAEVRSQESGIGSRGNLTGATLGILQLLTPATPGSRSLNFLNLFWHIHLELRDADNKRRPGIRETDESTFCQAIRTDNVITVVRESFSRPQARVLAHYAISLDDNFLTGLITDHPFPAADGDRFDRLIIDRDKVNKRVGPIGRRFECRHVNNLVDDHAKIRQFPKR